MKEKFCQVTIESSSFFSDTVIRGIFQFEDFSKDSLKTCDKDIGEPCKDTIAITDLSDE